MLTQPLPPQASPSLKQRTPICTRESVNPRQDGLFTHSVTLKRREWEGGQSTPYFPVCGNRNQLVIYLIYVCKYKKNWPTTDLLTSSSSIPRPQKHSGKLLSTVCSKRSHRKEFFRLRYCITCIAQVDVVLKTQLSKLSIVSYHKGPVTNIC